MRAISTAGVLRIAAAVIAGLGALVGILVHSAVATTTTAMSLSGFMAFDGSVIFWVAMEAGRAISSGFGLAGAGFALGSRLRTAAWLMLAGAVGYTIFVVLYTFITPILVPMPDVPNDPRYPEGVSEYLDLFLSPIQLSLVVGAALAFLARRARTDYA